MHDVDQRLTKDVDRLCSDLAELIPTMVSVCTWGKHWQHPMKHCLQSVLELLATWSCEGFHICDSHVFTVYLCCLE